MKPLFLFLSLALLTGCQNTPPTSITLEPGPTTVTPDIEIMVPTVVETDEDNSETIETTAILDTIETETRIIEESQAEITMTTEPDNRCDIFDDFSGNQNIGWQRVNDNVMGGRSIGGFEYVDNAMVLSGSINLNGGGFTSVRAPLAWGSLEPYSSVKLRIKTDGRGYQITFRDSNRQRLSHRPGFNLNASDDW